MRFALISSDRIGSAFRLAELNALCLGFMMGLGYLAFCVVMLPALLFGLFLFGMASTYGVWLLVPAVVFDIAVMVWMKRFSVMALALVAGFLAAIWCGWAILSVLPNPEVA